MDVPVQSPSPVAATYPVVKSSHESSHSKDDTIASNASPILDEETAVPSHIPLEIEEPKPELIALDSSTQTGKSLTLSPEKQIHIQVQTDSLLVEPSAIAIQTEDAEWLPKKVPKGKIKVLQKIEGDEETIEIATKSSIESQPQHFDQETRPIEDLTVELKYKDNVEGHDPAMTMSELNILHYEPQSFETVVMNPGESSMEVIVDADGTKRIIMKKSRRIISHHQHTLTSSSNIETIDTNPVAFSQVKLQQQQKTVTHALPDGRTEITTSQGYAGQITSGTHDGDITTSDFSNLPRQEIAAYHTFPSEMNVSKAFHPTEYELTEPTEVAEWASSSSTVRAVVHQVRRKIIKRTRRIIRRVTIIDGKEHVTEEVVEEPEEVEISEEGIPRVSFEISKDHLGGVIVQEPLEEQEYSLDPGVEISELSSEENAPGNYDIKEMSSSASCENIKIELMPTDLSKESSNVSETILQGDNSEKDENILFITNESVIPGLSQKAVNEVKELEFCENLPIESKKEQNQKSKIPKHKGKSPRGREGLKDDNKLEVVISKDKSKSVEKDNFETYIAEGKDNEPVSAKPINVLVSPDLLEKPTKTGKTSKKCKKSLSVEHETNKYEDIPNQNDDKKSLKKDSPATSPSTGNLEIEFNVNKIKNLSTLVTTSKTDVPINEIKQSDGKENEHYEQSITPDVLKCENLPTSEMKDGVDVLAESKKDMLTPKNSKKKKQKKEKKQESQKPAEQTMMPSAGQGTNSVPLKAHSEDKPIKKDVNVKKSHQHNKNDSLDKSSPSILYETDNLETGQKLSSDNLVSLGTSASPPKVNEHKLKENVSVLKDNLSSQTIDKEEELGVQMSKELSHPEFSPKKNRTKRKKLDPQTFSEQDVTTSITSLSKPETPVVSQSENEPQFESDSNITSSLPLISNENVKNVHVESLKIYPDVKEILKENELFIDKEKMHTQQLNNYLPSSESSDFPKISDINRTQKEKSLRVENDNKEQEDTIENGSFISSSGTELNQSKAAQKEETSVPTTILNESISENNPIDLLKSQNSNENRDPQLETMLEVEENCSKPPNIISSSGKENEKIEQSDYKVQTSPIKEGKVDVLCSKPPTDKLSNIEIEITVGGNLEIDENIPKVASDTKVEQKLNFGLSEDEMVVVKQKSDVVLPGVIEVTREIKSQSPESIVYSIENKNKTATTSPDNLSTPTSLAESMEIILTGTPNSSDTTKPTQQELFDVLSPRSDISIIDESVKTSDTGYEDEDKTFDESSVADNTSKSKKKKKKRQKFKDVSNSQGSSIEPKSSDFIPSETNEEINIKIEERDERDKRHKGKKTNKKPKEDHIDNINIADPNSEVVSEGSLKDISERSVSENIVRIVQESIPTRSSSEAEEFKSTNVLTSVPVLEVLPTQSESVQTTTPTPLTGDLIDTIEVAMQTTQETQEVSAQTLIPDLSCTEVCIQTNQADLVFTSDESAQTTLPEVQWTVKTTDSTVQTTKEITPNKQEEEIQTDDVKFSSFDNVDSGMQTIAECHPVSQEEIVQTSPEPEKIQCSSQVDVGDLIKTEEEESQTTQPLVQTSVMSTQIKTSDIVPVNDQFVQTIVQEHFLPATVQENIPPTVIELTDKKGVNVPELNNSEKVYDTKESLPVEVASNMIPQPVSKTENSQTQTRPIQFKENTDSTDSSTSVAYPAKIEIQAFLTYGPDTETDISTTDVSKSDTNVSEHSHQILMASPESTDSDISSWASHTAKDYHIKSKKGKKSKENKDKSEKKDNIAPVKCPDYEIVKIDESHVKHPDIKAKVQFDVEECDVSLKPQLTTEVSHDKNASSVFIQAEVMQTSPSNDSSHTKASGFSQVVEIDMLSKPETQKPHRTTNKSKRDRKIRQRSDTKALPKTEASLVLGPEELRGEHSPGPPEKEGSTNNDDVDKEVESTKSHSEIGPSHSYNFDETLTAPIKTGEMSFQSTAGDKIDLQLTVLKRPDGALSEEREITWKGDVSEDCDQFPHPVKELNSVLSSPEKIKLETEMLIESETTADSISSIDILPDDQDIKYNSDKKKKRGKPKLINDNVNNSETKQSSKILLDKSDEIKDEEIKLPHETGKTLDIQWKQMGTLISDRLKHAQNPNNSSQIIFLKPSDEIEVSKEERANQLEDNLDNLQHAVKKQDVIVIQQTIIITVETISTWLETIEYKIQHTKVCTGLI